MLKTIFLKTFYIFLISIICGQSLAASKVESLEIEDMEKFWKRAQIQIISRADYTLLPGRPLIIVSVNSAEISYRKSFYHSTGLNSGSKGTWFPFDNISGRFLDSKFVQTYVEKASNSRREIQCVSALLPKSSSEFAQRIGSWFNLGVSAFLGGGFWQSDEGQELSRKIGIVPTQMLDSEEKIKLNNAASVIAWMKENGCEVIPRYLHTNQVKYAQFSYEVMLSLLHTIDGVGRKKATFSFRDLCLRVHHDLNPSAMQLLVPGFTEEESTNDFSLYVDQNFSLDQYCVRKKGFLPISEAFYMKPATISNPVPDSSLHKDMRVISYLSSVKEFFKSGVQVDRLIEMNKRIDAFLDQSDDADKIEKIRANQEAHVDSRIHQKENSSNATKAKKFLTLSENKLCRTISVYDLRGY